MKKQKIILLVLFFVVVFLVLGFFFYTKMKKDAYTPPLSEEENNVDKVRGDLLKEPVIKDGKIDVGGVLVKPKPVEEIRKELLETKPLPIETPSTEEVRNSLLQ